METARAAVLVGLGRPSLISRISSGSSTAMASRAMHVAGIAQRVDLDVPMSRASSCGRVYTRPPKRHDAIAASAFPRSAASTVFESNIAMVIGPTPPGTGVIQRRALGCRRVFHVAARACRRHRD